MHDTHPLLDAQVHYFLDRLQGEPLRALLHEEIAQWYAWLDQVRLDEVVSPAQAQTWVDAALIHLPIYGEWVEMIEATLQDAHRLLRDDPTALEVLVPRKVYDQFVQQALGLEALKLEVIHQFVNSSVYAMLVSHVLYRGLKAFVLTDNALAKKIPGASSLMRLSQSALNAAAPQFEKSVDAQVTAFIHANIQTTIRESEAFLHGALDEAALHELADELWQANFTRSIGQTASFIDPASLAAAVATTKQLWLHLRTTAAFKHGSHALVENFLARYGQKSLRTLLDEMGLTPAWVEAQTAPVAAALLAKAQSSGMAEATLRRWLTPFFQAHPS